MLELEPIEFDGVKYPFRQVQIFQNSPEPIEVMVSVTDLEEKLFSDDGMTPVSHEAELIDGNIFYYCNEQEWNDLSEEEFIKMLENVY